MKKRSDYYNHTIRRYALILNTLGSQNKELVLSELSCLLGLHKSSVRPMLATLQDENFLHTIKPYKNFVNSFKQSGYHKK